MNIGDGMSIRILAVSIGINLGDPDTDMDMRIGLSVFDDIRAAIALPSLIVSGACIVNAMPISDVFGSLYLAVASGRGLHSLTSDNPNWLNRNNSIGGLIADLAVFVVLRMTLSGSRCTNLNCVEGCLSRSAVMAERGGLDVLALTNSLNPLNNNIMRVGSSTNVDGISVMAACALICNLNFNAEPGISAHLIGNAIMPNRDLG